MTPSKLNGSVENDEANTPSTTEKVPLKLGETTTHEGSSREESRVRREFEKGEDDSSSIPSSTMSACSQHAPALVAVHSDTDEDDSTQAPCFPLFGAGQGGSKKRREFEQGDNGLSVPSSLTMSAGSQSPTPALVAIHNDTDDDNPKQAPCFPFFAAFQNIFSILPNQNTTKKQENSTDRQGLFHDGTDEIFTNLDYIGSPNYDIYDKTTGVLQYVRQSKEEVTDRWGLLRDGVDETFDDLKNTNALDDDIHNDMTTERPQHVDQSEDEPIDRLRLFHDGVDATFGNLQHNIDPDDGIFDETMCSLRHVGESKGELVDRQANETFGNWEDIEVDCINNELSSLRYVGQSKEELQEIDFAIRHLVVDQSVRTIPRKFFRAFACELNELTTIEFPDNCVLEEIEEYAFQECRKLKSVRILKSVKKIWKGAFGKCSSLNSVEFTENGALEEIQDYAFWYCEELESISIPSLVKIVGRNAFEGCSSLKTVGLQEGGALEEIQEYTFWCCEKLKSINIPTSVTIIGHNAFGGCSSLGTVEFPEDCVLEEIHESSFHYCEALESIRIPSSVKTIRKGAFVKCSSLNTVELPENGTLEEIQDFAFQYCQKLESIRIPGSVKSIGIFAFGYCSLLKAVEFTKSGALEAIQESSFQHCEVLESIQIPASVKIIGDCAFQGCFSLQNIEFPQNSALEEIQEYSFQQCSNLESIEIPSLVKTIGHNAFESCSLLNSVKFPKDSALQEIRYQVFQKCEKLESIQIPSSVKIIGHNAFEKCSSLTTANFPMDSVLEEIKGYAFQKCERLGSIKIPTSVKIICGCAFQNCSSLHAVEFPEDGVLEEIQESTFQRCDSLESIRIPASVKVIGARAFADCRSMLFSRISGSVTEIGSEAFRNCSSLGNVWFVGGDDSELKFIGDDAFRGCKDLWNMRIPKSTVTTRIDSSFDCPLKEIQYRKRYDKLPVHELLYCTLTPDNDFDTDIITEKLDGLWKSNPNGFESFDDHTGMTPLHLYASLPAKFINVNILDRLVKRSPDKFLVHNDNKGRRPIHYACLMGESNVEILRLLSLNEDAFRGINDGCTPSTLDLRYRKLPIHAACLEYSFQPIASSMVSGDKEIARLKKIKKAYIDWIKNGGSIKNGSFSSQQQHGWVDFVMNHMEEKADEVELAMFVKDSIRCNRDTLESLAYAKDMNYNVAMKVASVEIKEAFESRLFFLGHYELAKGSPIHRSATCVVIKAEDAKMEEYYEKEFERYCKYDAEFYYLDKENFGKALEDMMMASVEADRQGSQRLDTYFDCAKIQRKEKISRKGFIEFCVKEFGRNVVLKFMKNKDQYQRELTIRIESGVALTNCIVPVIAQYDETKVDIKSLWTFIKDYLPGSERPDEYCHVLVMPYGDRNLDMIFRSERPDRLQVWNYAKQIALLLRKLHNYGLVHGDLKMSNIIRIKGRLMLIDLDASAKVGEEIGAKFSSGVVAPEMIYAVSGITETEEIANYYKYEDKENQQKRKPRFVGGERNKIGYLVRSFLVRLVVVEHNDTDTRRTQSESEYVPKEIDDLPYNIRSAKKSMDVWAFGVMLYAMCAGRPLFPTNLDDDITEGADLKNLYEWKTFHGNVDDYEAKTLLDDILQKDPEKRPTIEQILEHDFSNPKSLSNKIERVVQETRRIEHEIGEMIIFQKHSDRVEEIIFENDSDLYEEQSSSESYDQEAYDKSDNESSRSDDVSDTDDQHGCKSGRDQMVRAPFAYNDTHTAATLQEKKTLAVEDSHVEDTYMIGLQEPQGINPDNHDKSLSEKDLIVEEGMKRGNGKLGEDLKKTDTDNLSEKVDDGIEKMLDAQMMTNRMVKNFLNERICPRYIVTLPASKSSKWFSDEVKLYFVCPISMEIPIGTDGEMMGYELNEPEKWILDYGPSLLLVWKIARVVFAGHGIVYEENFLDEMERQIVGVIEGEQKQTARDVLTRRCIEDFTDLTYDGKQVIPDYYREEGQKSFDGIFDSLQDPQFEKSGLKLATCFRDGTSEFVHPDIVSLYEEYGEKCFRMTPEVIRAKRTVATERCDKK